ncbi:MAG: type II toxin-antitoxin system HicA family toxin [Cyclobacteriaceae bacterium]|nr:MAG: type II toxin-antitoxin system HicA family toxin [Cyclobacteriaceae bacterium]
MSTTSSYTSKAVIKLLEERGFVLHRVKGSHHIFKSHDGSKRVIVPMHNRDLPKGTFYAILKQAGIDKKSI